ncbi:MAG TPA: PP2C family protein-serine/threonine phosphatase, partial [Pyrinomonadaceae bacterium]|nr:PP2C family protein-serine/threonine phosphatase [Pyrinomonadaceae bacterium]
MSLRRLTVPLLLAVVGYAALLLLAQRFDPSTKWGYKFDRAAATERARQAAREFYAIDTTGWEAWLTAEHQQQQDFYLNRYGAPEGMPFVGAVRTTVLLVEPTGEQRRIRVRLNPNGHAYSFSYRTYKPPEAAPETPPAVSEETRRVATEALARLVGNSETGTFRLVSETPQKSGETNFLWESVPPVGDGLKLQGVGVVRGTEVREMSISTNFAPRVSEEYTTTRERVTGVDMLNIVAIPLVVMTVAVCLFLGLIRREVLYKQPLALLLWAFFVYLIYQVFSGGHESDMLGDVFTAQRGSESKIYLSAAVELLMPSFFFAVSLALVWAAGLMQARRTNPLPYASFAALLRGNLLSSFVASRICTGLLLGGVLAAIPYVVAATGLFGALPDEPNPRTFLTSLPALATLPSLPFPIFTIYGFLVPLFGRRGPGTTTRAARTVGLVIGCLWLGEAALSQPSSGAVLLAGGLLAVAADQIYRRYDFLTLIVATLASDIAIAAAGLFIQTPETLRRGGMLTFVGLGACIALTLFVALKGRETREADEAAIAPPGTSALGQQAERERLLAEFNVARNAQQRMLPEVPPTIPGYRIAAACRPAREVGGDLYDFFVLPDERVGIVVADVSGKGVPAALYMTLTKGLLASVAEHESDPAAILREINPHLHEVCRRKVFVTLILGVLDPATRTLTYARAGHNPGIWSSSSSRELKLLSAPG